MKTIKERILSFDLTGLWSLLWLACTAYFWFFLNLHNPSFSAWSLPLNVIIAAGIALLASYVLWAVRFFSIIRIAPLKSDFFLFLFAMGVASGVLALLLLLGFHAPKALLVQMAVSLPIVSAAYFSGYVFFTQWLGRNRKRRITLRLRPEETRQYLEALEEAGLIDQIELVPASEVLAEFAEGNRPKIDLIVFSRGGSRDMRTDRFLLRAHLAGIRIKDRRSTLASLTRKVDLEDLDVWSFVSSASSQSAWQRFTRMLRESVEPVQALVLIVAFLPLLLILAVCIKYTSPGPVFYSQRRTGYYGKVFKLYKLRSMRTDSESSGYQWASKGDSRITPFGKFLRKSRLDELPQLWNVVRGDMSFIGPRPERPEIYRDLKETIPLFSLRTDVRPGITGWAQICSGYAASVDETRLKLEHDLYYIQNMSVRLDIVIFLLTIKVMLFGNEFIDRPKVKFHRTASILSGMFP